MTKLEEMHDAIDRLDPIAREQLITEVEKIFKAEQMMVYEQYTFAKKIGFDRFYEMIRLFTEHLKERTGLSEVPSWSAVYLHLHFHNLY